MMSGWLHKGFCSRYCPRVPVTVACTTPTRISRKRGQWQGQVHPWYPSRLACDLFELHCGLADAGEVVRRSAHPAVLQVKDSCVITLTLNPNTHKTLRPKIPAYGAAQIYTELVVGLGESIVSGLVPGSALSSVARKDALDQPRVRALLPSPYHASRGLCIRPGQARCVGSACPGAWLGAERCRPQ